MIVSNGPADHRAVRPFRSRRDLKPHPVCRNVGRQGAIADRRPFLSDGQPTMSEVTRILEAIDRGDPGAANQLLPLVYDELRRLAARRLSREPAGQTLQATGLVHEAYLRLVDVESAPQWNGRGHFFAAAAEAMRRILVENARRKRRLKHGGGRRRVDLDAAALAADGPAEEELLAVDEALGRLAAEEPQAAELVKLHYFAGLTIEQAAEVLGVSARKGYRIWAYARAWLFRSLGSEEPGGG
jgi:RNA polymerase sigma factor (TIGR02999 family)